MSIHSVPPSMGAAATAAALATTARTTKTTAALGASVVESCMTIPAVARRAPAATLKTILDNSEVAKYFLSNLLSEDKFFLLDSEKILDPTQPFSPIIAQELLEERGIEVPLEEAIIVLKQHCFEYCRLFLSPDAIAALSAKEKGNIFQLYTKVHKHNLTAGQNEVDIQFNAFIKTTLNPLLRAVRCAAILPPPLPVETELKLRLFLEAGANQTRYFRTARCTMSAYQITLCDIMSKFQISHALIRLWANQFPGSITSVHLYWAFCDRYDGKTMDIIFKQLKGFDPAYNPLDRINFCWSDTRTKPELLVQKLAKKFPVTPKHLSHVMYAQFSEETIRTLLESLPPEATLEDSCIDYLFNRPYSEDLICSCLPRLGPIEAWYFQASIHRLNHSLETLQLLLDRTPVLDGHTLVWAIQELSKRPFRKEETERLLKAMILKCPGREDAMLSSVSYGSEPVFTFHLQHCPEYRFSQSALWDLFQRGFSNDTIQACIDQYEFTETGPQETRLWFRALQFGYSFGVVARLYLTCP